MPLSESILHYLFYLFLPFLSFPTMSIRIPCPFLEHEETFPIARLTGPEGNLHFHWWVPQRSVIVQITTVDRWYLMPDCVIRDCLADLMECHGSELTPGALYMMTTADGGGGYLEPLPEKIAETFLDCEWSDFACDRRPVVGHIDVRLERAQAPHSDEEADQPALTPQVLPRVRRDSYK